MDKQNKVFLRPISINDTENIVKWRNSSFVLEKLINQDLLTVEMHTDYYLKKIATKQIFQFIIVSKEDKNEKDIGTTFLKNIDYILKQAEFGIFIGEKDACGHGYGTEAVKLTIKYAFENLSLNKIYLTVFKDNINAIKAYERVGFKQEKTKSDICFETNNSAIKSDKMIRMEMHV